MSPIWIALAILSALLALVCEFWMAHRENRTRHILEQPLNGGGRIRNRLSRSLFFTTVLCLLFGIFLAGSHKQWTHPIQGVALVIDTAVQTQNASDRLALEKAAAVELIRSLPGEAFSLWELGGNVVQEVVPPTIDRLFLEVQLDGLLPSSPSGTRPTLSSVHDTVVQRTSNVPPWVVCLSRSDLPIGRGRFDGAASIIVSLQSVLCTVIEDGLSRNESSIEQTGAVIARRLARSFTTTPPDTTETLLLSAAALIGLLCCLMWRKAVPPIATLCLLLCSTVGAISPASANNEAKQAIDLAGNADFSSSEGSIDTLLTTINDPEARGRLLYNRALLAYLQGRDHEALQWITMEPSTLDHEPTAAETLRGMALIRLVLSSTTEHEEKTRKQALATWLRIRPPVDSGLIAYASLALIAPPSRIPDIDSVRRSLFWLEECAQDGASADAEGAADLLTQKMSSSIERSLEALWPKKAINGFLSTMQMQGPHKISALRIWYDFASAAAPDEGISFLLHQASTSAQSALYFPNSSAQADLNLVSSLLPQLIPGLPEDQRPLLTKILAPTRGDAAQHAAEWYARATIWPGIEEGKGLLKPLALILFEEVDLQKSPPIRQSLTTLVHSILPLPSTPLSSNDSLEAVVRQVLATWYMQDPLDAIDGALRAANHFPIPWTSRLTELLTPPIHGAMNGLEPLPKAVSEGLGGALPQTDVALSARIWQIAISPCKTPQDTTRYVDHLTLLFSELAAKLITPNDPVYRSLVLMYSVQPLMLEQLRASGVFQKNPAKQALYDQLLFDWEESCSSVKQRLAEPLSFRLPRVQQDVNVSIQVLHRLQALLRESEATPPAQPQENRPENAPENVSEAPSVRGEDAVRLFQEMDRSDRSL
jgi:hypothetical protein